MPIYEYNCSKCNNTIERNVPVEDRDNQKCMVHNILLTRIMSKIAGVDFSKGGSGFYKNDYKGK